MNKQTIVGYIISGLVVIISIIFSIARWLFVYYDPSNFLLFSAMGVIAGAAIAYVSYDYSWKKIISNKIQELDESILTLNAWNSKQQGEEEWKTQ